MSDVTASFSSDDGSFDDESGTAVQDPLAILEGQIGHDTIREFRQVVFSSVREIERLQEWTDSPMSFGIQRGLVLWALARHEEALEELVQMKDNPAIAACLAQSYVALGRLDEAESVLLNRDSDPIQAAIWLSVVEHRGDAEALANETDRLHATLGHTDALFFQGRAKEMSREPMAAIAAYDEVLAIDGTHPSALFRLAINVDLRGEDEEARELYERALMHPPVNTACVMNLGILYEDIGNFRRAMQCFDLVLQAQPRNARARLYRRDAAAALNMYYDEDQERREDKRNKILRTPINDFELSVRSRNCLAKMGVYTLGDLVKKTEAELLSYKNFGETSLLEIKEILRNKGLRLGMGHDELMSAPIGEPEETTTVTEEAPDPNHPDPTRRPVTLLDLSVRSRRIVDLLKIRTIGDLSNKTEAELLACPNFGQTSLNEIKTKLDELGLSLRA